MQAVGMQAATVRTAAVGVAAIRRSVAGISTTYAKYVIGQLAAKRYAMILRLLYIDLCANFELMQPLRHCIPPTMVSIDKKAIVQQPGHAHERNYPPIGSQQERICAPTLRQRGNILGHLPLQELGGILPGYGDYVSLNSYSSTAFAQACIGFQQPLPAIIRAFLVVVIYGHH
jgi:hypothetical protein